MTRWVAWPGWDNLRQTLPLCLLTWGVFMTVYHGANYLTGLHTYRVRLDLPGEAAIPLWPAWCAVYMSVNLMFVLSPFVLRTRAEMWLAARPMLIETLIAGVFFLLVPVQLAYPTPNLDDFWSHVYRTQKHLSLQYNCFPSLHVTFAVTMAILLGRTAPRWGQQLLWLWAILITLSTLFTHEHHLLDLVAGYALARWAVARWGRTTGANTLTPEEGTLRSA